ncbi:MAG: sugar phosphate isomerase/epimerase [Acidobacteria bacterium]|nr:sugar phosphate isomerase/epimerase [Acidobacteriota bacterium]
MTTRRQFMAAAALAAADLRAAKLKTVGVQLYTVRSILPQKPEETLKAIRAIGYQEIEATFAGFDKIWPAVEASGLKPVSMHMDNAMVMRGGDELARAVDSLKQYGFQYAVHPYVPPAERGGPEVMKTLGGKLNHLGELAKKAGMQACYHNHAFEFATPADASQTLFETLATNTDPKLVHFEVDLFWVSVAGLDPADFLRKHKGRVSLVHLKDKAQGTEQRYNENVPRTAFKEVGNGVIDWTAVLKAASEAGTRHYFVEQDQTPGDPIESLRQSFAFLSK